jgi:hypothetical protein
MSWMTKEGSLSASGQSPLDFPLSERALHEVVRTRHDATGATSCVCVVADRRSSHPATKGAIVCRGARPWKPLGKGGVYRFEGFG